MEINKALTPNIALMFYSNGGEHYIEKHDVKAINGTPTLLAGQPLQKKALTKICQAILSDSDTPLLYHNGIFPRNILQYKQGINSYKLVWFRKAKSAPMYFTDYLKIPDGMANQPNLIFSTDGNHIWIWAYKGQEEPTEETELFKAPYHNTIVNDGICWGTGKKAKGKELNTIMEDWENGFFMSKFTHSGQTNNSKGNLNTLWKSLIKTGDQFPEDKLLSANKKLKDIL